MDPNTLHLEHLIWDLEEEHLICRLLAAVAQPIPRVIQTGPQEIIP
jgi:hypothetical protein